MMKRVFLLFFLLLLTNQAGFALNVVYPKQQNVTINSPSTFFVGSVDKKSSLTINGKPVTVHSSGGFAQAVPLNSGVNSFVLKSGKDSVCYKITRPVLTNKTPVSADVFKEYGDVKYAEITSDNTPLRSSPVDGGINRISHLQKGIPLTVDGEKGRFYRVILTPYKQAWVPKSSVKFVSEGTSLAELKGYDYIDTDEFFIFVFHLSKQTLWELVEGDPFLIKLYNVWNEPDNTYVMTFPQAEASGGKKLLGYSARFSGNDFIVKIRKPRIVERKAPLKNIRIAIDAGHGGSESGAVGCLGDLEKDVNLAFAKHLQNELKSKGAEVIMIRENDSTVGLNERVDFANSEDAMIFISLHGNALPDSLDPMKNFGTEIYYYYNQAKPLAALIMASMVDRLNTNNHGIRQESFAVVRNPNALSILIEVGYLINPADNAKLVDKNFQKDTAKAISDGIANFFLKQ